MAEKQLSLFDDKGPDAAAPAPSLDAPSAIAPVLLSDDDLIAGLSDADMGHCLKLVEEIGRRRLTSAIPGLEAVCQRHVGFGARRVIPEQAAAVQALIAIGGIDAAKAVARLVAHRAMQGPGLALILKAAARMDAILPEEAVIGYLRHDDRDVRAIAAGCVRRWPRAVPTLIELLDDLHDDVRFAAACALGRMGRAEARAILVNALRVDPSEEVIRAIAEIADEECIILLGRAASARPDLAPATLGVLESIDHPRAEKVAAALRASAAVTATKDIATKQP